MTAPSDKPELLAVARAARELLAEYDHAYFRSHGGVIHNEAEALRAALAKLDAS